MDTFDYQRSSVPARQPSQRTLSPVMQRFGPESNENPPSPISVRAVLRASRRYWWLILALWVVGSAGIGAAVHFKVKPVFRAQALLKVDPTVIDLYGTGRGGEEPYMQTHVVLIKSQTVLADAASKPAVTSLPRMQGVGDAIQELSKVIQVAIQPGTYIIEVSMTSNSATEAATLVNAVVEAFLDANRDWSNGATKQQLDKLSTYRDTLKSDVKSKKELLERKVAGGGGPKVVPVNPGEEGNNWTVDSYRSMLSTVTGLKLELLTAENDLAEAQTAAQEASRESAVIGNSKGRPASQVELRLKTDPELLAKSREWSSLYDKAEKIKKDSRDSYDPAEQKARQRLKSIQSEYTALREQKRQLFQEQAMLHPGENNAEADVARLTLLVKNLRSKKEVLENELKKNKLDNIKEQGNDLEIEFARQDLSALQEMQRIVDRRVEQLTFETSSENRIRLMNEARAEGRPISDKRMQYMAMAPVGVLGLVLGLVILMEIRSGRVADTEVLAARMKQEIFAIAPLPNLRPGIRGDGDRAEQKLARFVQSLDHLRVALCEGGMNGEGRCVMITSATGGEGKTTLSAHLAARCANAGTSTLLIDADLRRASLGRLLDVPSGMGLGDVLAGEVELNADLIIPQAAGFHFLSAGTPGIDPTRVLKSTRLAELIGQLRQMYDLVIIDTPPVLPVADALIMGRWADGAVMAARFDASRLPLVERANRQIIAAGIPVLGVVVNGVKGQDQAYGSYAYNYSYPGRQNPTTDAVDVS